MVHEFRGVKYAGFILVICLIILMLLNMVVMRSMQSSSLQHHMSDDLRDGIEAMSNAESALMAAQSMKEKLSNYDDFDLNLDDGLSVDIYNNAWKQVDWQTQARATENGSYVIQYIGSRILQHEDHDGTDDMQVESTDSFKITAKGVSKNNQAIIFLEVMFYYSLSVQSQSQLLGRRSWHRVGL